MDKPNPSPEIKMDAYIILLHLRSRGWIRTSEIWKLLGWTGYRMAKAMHRFGHINAMTEYLSERWGEDIPKINAFVFTADGKCTDYICKNVFGTSGEDEQPCAKEIAEHAAKIAAYPKWDKFVEVFRREAFEAQDSKFNTAG
ncbi:MAG: hypothetical protein OXI63_23525 [Candidatus Poribacteria bacterium]|nr:hypothetical protein [Candidatus Poribacteria bacterium]